MKRAAVPCLGLAVLLTIAASGCLFGPKPESEEEPLPPAPLPMPFPDSEDQVIANFKAAYTAMRIDDYRAVLHPRYAFILRPEEVLPGGSGRFNYAEEFTVAENMFSGMPIERPGDTPLPAIAAISIAVINRQGAWFDVGPSDPDFPNTKRALYEIQLTFSQHPEFTVIVSGQQEFYVASRDSTVNGETKRYFQLRGQRDLSNGRKIAESSWGELKRLYLN